ncbi:MAG: MogA/MoaB family molybdenum cofactor biosynthesis protein [Elusimicrobia bacterium]|nr:MogA/MoaB family molybdenum cofactor biosynthesis protein [Elusimicrobiota bacterium]
MTKGNGLKITVGILTISDRCSKGLRRDESGPALRRLVESQGWRVAQSAVEPDEREKIKETLLDWSDGKGLALILTTGGTGLGPRDVTPEATRGALDKELPGLVERMRLEGSKRNERAVLSRAIAGARGRSLILNLPGSPRGATDSLKAVLNLVPHALAMLQGEGHEKDRVEAAR